jgi:ligand-binding sensor domain-containing protein
MQHPFDAVKYLFLLWLTVLAGPALTQTSLKFKHLTVKDGLSNDFITSMLQDRKGFIWFGTQDGLNKYDGYSFTSYKYRPHDSTSISHNLIFKAWEDKQGLIWIGTPEDGICKFDPATEQFTTYHPPQSKNSILHPFRSVSAFNEDREEISGENCAGSIKKPACFPNRTS